MGSSPFEYANLANLSLIEQLYTDYLQDPMSVDPSWRHFFEGMALGTALTAVPGKEEKVAVGAPQGGDERVFRLIEAYRTHGHRAAKINPVAKDILKPEQVEELKLDNFAFNEGDLKSSFPTYGFLAEERAPLSSLIAALQNTYSSSIGFEYSHLSDRVAYDWLRSKIESHLTRDFHKEEKKELLRNLSKAEFFEEFLQLKYPGQKRFSIEGGETLIPMLQTLVDEGKESGVEELILGMAHRGRLNVLANIFGKPYREFFEEFEPGYRPSSLKAGDVKYHKGYVSDLKAKGGVSIKGILCENPSHLESIDPVACGRARARQEKRGFDKGAHQILPILIHGDASLSGQGVVYETMQLFKLPGYRVGGTLHIVVNNQVGFTATARELKSTFYCTDLAQTFGSPVFHVNAEDPESCMSVIKLALAFRQRFSIDVFIELNCYRKYGHNESDEPSFTQPVLYQTVRSKTSIRELYKRKLLEEGSLTEGEVEEVERQIKGKLEEELTYVKEKKLTKKEGREEKPPLLESVETAVPLEVLSELTKQLCVMPDGFHLHRKIKRIIDERYRAITGDSTALSIDWGMAETLAYASLLTREHVHIRLAGQDSGRGTFSHRHAIVVDQENGKRYYPLSHLSEGQSLFDVYNAPLSEYAALGFEYGYSLSSPQALVIWEAQFGDFANAAQIMIDQYLASAEVKWDSQSPLTLFLPHGYEGQGPEHSSARIERYLQLAADDNMSIIIPTTAAQMFHLLRRQALTPTSKPLILFTPKALLRFHPSLASPKMLAEGAFQEVIDDPSAPSDARFLMMCSGKVYYDLVEEREKRKRRDIALVRIEQLYPLQRDHIRALFTRYSQIEHCLWVQEEHQNMGAWNYLYKEIETLLPEKLSFRYVGRVRSASTATGSPALHKDQRAALLNEAFSI